MRGNISALITLLLLSGGFASTFNINSLETVRESKENLTITYNIILDNPEITTYVISLNNIPLIEKTESFKEINETINYNVTNIPAGNYVLNLKVNNTAGSITSSAPSNITIQREVNMQTITPGKIYIGGIEANAQATIINNGNTDLDISAYFRNAQSEITLTPQSFKLKMNENRNILINVKKPETDYNATLTIIATNQQDEIKKEYNTQILTPAINVTITNATLQETSNDTIISMIIKTTGNVDANAIINIRTFSISEGFNTYNDTITLYANTDTLYNKTINRKGVTGVTVIYNNGTSNLEVSHEFNIINKLPLGINGIDLSKDRIILLVILAAVIIGVLYFKRKKKVERP